MNMTQTFDLVLKNGTVHTPGGPAQISVGVRGGKIAAMGDGLGDAGEVVDCRGLDILPGVIDSQVHFREPGLENKEDLEARSEEYTTELQSLMRISYAVVCLKKKKLQTR